MPKYDRNQYVSQISDDVDLETLLTFDDDRIIGNRMTAIHLTTWDAVKQFKAQQKKKP